MVIQFQDQSGLGQGISQFGSALGGALQQRGQQEQKQLQQGLIMQLLMGDQAPPVDPNASPGVEGQDQAPKSPITELKQITQNAKQAQRDDTKAALAYTVDPMLGKFIQEKAYKKSELEQKEIDREQKKDTDLWNYKPTVDFMNDVRKGSEEAELGNEIADEIIELSSNPETNPANIRTYATSIAGEKMPFLFTPITSRLKFAEKMQAKGLKSIFPRPTEREFLFIQSASAQLGKTPEANIAIANLQKKFNNTPIKRAEFLDEVIQENGGVPPRDLSSQVRKKMNKYKDEIIKDSAAITAQFGDGKEKLNAKSYLGQDVFKDLKKELKDESAGEGKSWMMDPFGNARKVPTQDINIWINKGGKLIR